MQRNFITALKRLDFLQDKSVYRESSFIYVNPIKSLLIGLVREGGQYFIFLGESLRDFFKIRLRDNSVDSIMIGLSALRRTEQYKLSITRMKYI